MLMWAEFLGTYSRVFGRIGDWGGFESWGVGGVGVVGGGKGGWGRRWGKGKWREREGFGF